MADEHGLVSDPPGATDGCSASRLARFAQKGSSLSSQLHSPSHHGFTAVSLHADDSPSECRTTFSLTSFNTDAGGSPDTGESLRRTGSGDIIIGEVLLMRPCRRNVASGEMVSDMVQVELESKTDYCPDSHEVHSQVDDETPASWIKRGKTVGKMVGLLALVFGWFVLVAGFSTYYFLGPKLAVLSTNKTVHFQTAQSVALTTGVQHHHH